MTADAGEARHVCCDYLPTPRAVIVATMLTSASSKLKPVKALADGIYIAELKIPVLFAS